MPDPSTAFPGPWPDVRPLLLEEVDAYMVTGSRPEVRTAPTNCDPWTGDDVTAHLVETFVRFSRMLEQSRTGDLTPPFAPDELDDENLRAVAAFAGDPVARLRPEVERFCDQATDPDELMAHQLGPIPVGLQQHFGLADLALHHHDLRAAVGERYVPPEPVVGALADAWRTGFDFDAGTGAGRWPALLEAAGR